MDITKELKPLRIIFFSMVSGLSVLLLITISLSKQATPILTMNPQTMYVLQTIVFMAFLILVPLAYYLHSNKLKLIKNTTDKMQLYRNSMIIKLTLIEAAGFLSGVAYMISLEKQFLLITGMALVLLLLNKPSEARLERELDL